MSLPLLLELSRSNIVQAHETLNESQELKLSKTPNVSNYTFFNSISQMLLLNRCTLHHKPHSPRFTHTHTHTVIGAWIVHIQYFLYHKHTSRAVYFKEGVWGLRDFSVSELHVEKDALWIFRSSHHTVCSVCLQYYLEFVQYNVAEQQMVKLLMGLYKK